MRATQHPSQDPALDAAAERARATFGYLWREVTWEERRIVPALGSAAVKAAFADGDVVEHLWLVDLGFDGRTVPRSRFRGADDRYPGHWLSPLPVWPSALDAVLAGELRVTARRALDQLPPRQRAAVVLPASMELAAK